MVAEFPCVGAKSALAKGTLDVIEARDIRWNWDDQRIYDGITHIVQNYRRDRELFQSFAVIFHGPVDLDRMNLSDRSGRARKVSRTRTPG